jgi:formylmethanofuran dehydrogenase subunit B
MTATATAGGPWTCPFCPLACDHLGVAASPDGNSLALRGGRCERAEQALARVPAAAAVAFVDGEPVPLDSAIAAAALRLGASRQPLFAGLGTDVDGARALYPLACATGALTDAAGGDALAEGLRALQDRGQFTTTLAEVRTRADLVVFVGTPPLAMAPLLRERLGIGEAQGFDRHIAVLGADLGAVAGWTGAGVTAESIAAGADLFEIVALLAAAVAGRVPAPAPLQGLVARLRAARYAVIVGAPALLPAHSALLIEAVHRAVHTLNRSTRAAALWVGGGQGAATANQVFAWLGGLPVRSRAGPRGLEHDPHAYSATRVLADGAADLLLWVSSFEADALPPAASMPLVALAHPAQAAACRRAGTVFIGVATPGIGHGGHLFRTDGTVLMPLNAARSDALPSVADVARRLLAALPRREAA